MPRGSFKHQDASQGFGFQEGNFLVEKSVISVFQFPPNAKTGKQSDPFVALVWTGKKLNDEWEPINGDETEATVIPFRLGGVADMRPGSLALKDIDNEDVEPEDLGAEVGVEGNSLFVEPGKKVYKGSWTGMDESLQKCGFKPEIAGRGYAPDYQGMVLHCKTVSDGTYKDKNTGESKENLILVADKVHTFPYEKKGKANAAKAGAKPANTPIPAKDVAGKAGSGAGAGKADAVEGATRLETAKALLADPSQKFKDAVHGQVIDRKKFQMAVMQELTKQKVQLKQHKPVMELIKDDEGLMELAGEVGFAVDLEEGTVAFEEAE